MSIFEAIVQGMIQGFTEFLPISSSGHLSISQHIFGIKLPGILFDIMLHLGTLVAVLFVYRMLILRLFKAFFSLCKDLVQRKFRFSEMDHDRRLLIMLIIGLIPLFLLFMPIPGTDMKIKDLSEQFATDSSILVEGIALLATSAVLFLGIRANKKTKTEKTVVGANGNIRSTDGRKKINIVDALLIGLSQFMAAVFPGLSRSGSTLSTGLMRGINKQVALDYSFILGVPAIMAAALVSIKDVGTDISQVGVAPLIAGVIASAIVGFFAIKVLKWIVSSDKLQIFAYYALIVGGIVTIIAIIEHVMGQNIFTGMNL